MTEFPQLGGFDRPVAAAFSWSFYLVVGLVLTVVVGTYLWFNKKEKEPSVKKVKNQSAANILSKDIRLN